MGVTEEVSHWHVWCARKQRRRAYHHALDRKHPLPPTPTRTYTHSDAGTKNTDIMLSPTSYYATERMLIDSDDAGEGKVTKKTGREREDSHWQR